VAHLFSQTLGTLFVASYDSQGYGGSIDSDSSWTGINVVQSRDASTENTVSIVIAIIPLLLFIRCRLNVFTKSLPSNERLF
jgi:hypothetical protein